MTEEQEQQERDAWLEAIGKMLKDDVEASRDQRVSAYRVAQQIAKSDAAFAMGVPEMYMAWVKKRQYLLPPERLDARLPQDVMQKRNVHTYQGGQRPETSAEWEGRVVSRRKRVDRAEDYLRAGWPAEDCVQFVCSREEWLEATEHAHQAQSVYEQRRGIMPEQPAPAPEPEPVPEQEPFSFPENGEEGDA